MDPKSCKPNLGTGILRLHLIASNSAYLCKMYSVVSFETTNCFGLGSGASPILSHEIRTAETTLLVCFWRMSFKAIMNEKKEKEKAFGLVTTKQGYPTFPH